MKTSKIVKILTSILIVIVLIWIIYSMIVPSSAQGLNIMSLLLISPYIFLVALLFSIIAVYGNKKQKLRWVILVITAILLVISIILLKIFLGLPLGAGTNWFLYEKQTKGYRNFELHFVNAMFNIYHNFFYYICNRYKNKHQSQYWFNICLFFCNNFNSIINIIYKSCLSW